MNIQSYLLEPRYSNVKSFYGKAIVTITPQKKVLSSYNTEVCVLDNNNNIVDIGYYSLTTSRHINEFIQQHGHNKMTKKDILNFNKN